MIIHDLLLTGLFIEFICIVIIVVNELVITVHSSFGFLNGWPKVSQSLTHHHFLGESTCLEKLFKVILSIAKTAIKATTVHGLILLDIWNQEVGVATILKRLVVIRTTQWLFRFSWRHLHSSAIAQETTITVIIKGKTLFLLKQRHLLLFALVIILDVFLVFRDIAHESFNQSANLMRPNNFRIEVKPILIEYFLSDSVHITALSHKR